MVADAKTHLDQAVKDGNLTQSQADDILSHVKQYLTDLVNGTLRAASDPRSAADPGSRPRWVPSFRQSGVMGTGWGDNA